MLRVGRDGVSEVVAEGLVDPGPLAADADGVYWVSRSEKVLWVLFKGAKAPKNFTTAELTPQSVAADKTSIYVAASTGAALEILKVSKKSGTQDVLFKGEGGAGNIALDATHLYLADQTGSIKKIPKKGGPAVTLVSDQSPSGIAVDETQVYWADFNAGRVVAIAKSGGTPVVLADNPLSDEGEPCKPTFLALDKDSVYFTAITTRPAVDYASVVMKIPKGGGDPATLDRSFGAAAIAVGAGGVYWTAPYGGAVRRIAP